VALRDPYRLNRRRPRDEGEIDQDRLTVAQPGTLLHQRTHDGPHRQNLPSHTGTVLIPLDLVVHDGPGGRASKNGVRYRFYVSSALLRGRKATVGSVGRVPAARIEDAVRSALESHPHMEGLDHGPPSREQVQRVVVARDRLIITIAPTDNDAGSKQGIKAPWSHTEIGSAVVIDRDDMSEGVRSENLIQAIVRAHV
jgi:site-specific DNA recombinase